MNSQLTRRDMLRGTVAFASVAFAQAPLAAFGFADPEAVAEPLPFLDKQAGTNGIQWDKLTAWATPSPDVYHVQHYGVPKVDLARWKLDISGLVKKPKTFTLADLKARPRKTITATIECSGNSNSAGFMGAIGNVTWTGTPLAPLLRECGPLDRAIEIVFFGADEKIETIRQKDYLQNFARSLHIKDAILDEILLCYEMNGTPLNPDHGAPLRLVVPGWFGIAWVKWLTRIELIDRRYMSKYMAREYVTLRGEEKEGKMIWRETSIGPMDVKSIIARALKLKDGTVRLTGAAWTDGTPLKKVEVQIDNGPWQAVTLDKKNQSKYSWTFFSFDWKKPAFGEHTVVSRATDAEGRVQPSAEDPAIKLKRTYWEANQQWPRKLMI